MGIVFLTKPDHAESSALSRVLGGDGADVVTVETAEAARGLLNSPYTDVGVVDLDQWGLQGIREVLKLKEGRASDPPVLLLSSGACIQAEEAAWTLQTPAILRVRRPWSACHAGHCQEDHPIDVLVVDDDEQVRNLPVEWLKRQGYNVRQAPSGEAALETARRVLPALVLLDIQMPGLNGVEVLARLQELVPNAAPPPVVMLSGSSDRTLPRAALTCGASAFLPKPTAFAVLRLAMTLALSQASAAPGSR